ncbi:heme exporter protein CcmB [Ignatzschineria rhizosphaerae]|uniref:Heme exporter protein B n=1 Tax=Ignatzschineria rhizosphaerae TaxID=2923279 RepID=A0ABY3WXX4_9GAMM|nr:heme exporter protein CcmB [Ignatzschineria rhizosphaerae]UNM95459.1 heme exporter protein CcmB [Ignatzschineria rhizosphaerae]
MLKLLSAVMIRDFKIGMRNRSEIFMPLVFFLIIISLFPLGLGLENQKLLLAAAPAILWIAALLSTILVLDRVFKNDFEDGSLEQMAISGAPLYFIILGKMISHWLLTGLPLVIFSPVLAVMLGFTLMQSWVVALILLIGTPLLSLIGAMCVALIVGLRQAGLLLSIITLPLYIPVLLIGVQLISRLQEGHSLGSLMMILIGGDLAAIILAPLVTTFAIKMSLD